MKCIIKQNEPQSFIDWKALENEDWRPCFDNLANPEKKRLKEALLVEQGYICCYCNRQISDEDGHIEHFKPQSDYQELALDYNNLHVSCLKEQSKSTPKHCGVAKGNWFEEGVTLSPLDTSCEQKFRYTDDGHISPLNDPDRNTQIFINRLNLDDAILIQKRKEAIAGWLDDDLIQASNAELQRNITALETMNKGEYTPFVIAIRQQLASLMP